MSDGIDSGRLAAWLTSQGLLGRAAGLVVERISGGNQNIVARLGGGVAPMILRRPPVAVPDGRNAAMAREFRLLTAHGDYSFLNVMFGHGPAPKLAAIVDWEMATIGDPLLDLAWLARQWPENADEVQTRWVDYSGMPLRDEIVDHYRQLTGRPAGNFAYYEVLANFKVAIVLEGGYARYLNGQATSDKVAHYNEAILKAGRTAGEIAAGSRGC